MANEPLEPLLVTAAELYPPPGTADAIRRRARTIRRRRRTTLSAASVMAVAGLLVQLGRVEGTSTLRPARDPMTTNVTPAPAGSTPTPGPSTSSTPQPRTHTGGGQQVRPPVRPAPSYAVVPSALPSGHRPVVEPYGTFTVLVDDADAGSQTGALTCDASAGWSAGPTGWCLKQSDTSNDSTAPTTGTADEWWLGVWACRMPGSGTGTIGFASPPRLRVRATDSTVVFDTEVRWRGRSPSYTGMYRKPDTVSDASCQFVGVRWDTRGDAGELVPEGRYTYDFDFGDPAFGSWNAADSGPSIDVTYGDVH